MLQRNLRPRAQHWTKMPVTKLKKRSDKVRDIVAAGPSAAGASLKNIWKILGYAVLSIVLVGGYLAYRVGLGKPFSINQLANRQAIFFLVANPEIFTQGGILDGTIFDRHSGKLSAVGVQKRDNDYAIAAKYAAEVKKFDRGALGLQEQLTFDILLDQYDSQLTFQRFDWLSSEGLYPIAPMWGTQVQLPNFLETSHVVTNAKTAINYIKRAQGGIADTMRPQPNENPLVTTFVERMKLTKGLDSDTQGRLAEQAAQIVGQRIYPAFYRMTAALETQRDLATTQAAGVWRLPNGAAYYASMLKQMPTTDYTPEQVHALGLSEVARINAEMDGLLKAQG